MRTKELPLGRYVNMQTETIYVLWEDKHKRQLSFLDNANKWQDSELTEAQLADLVRRKEFVFCHDDATV